MEQMTTEYQPTREEVAYGRLLEEKHTVLSEAARTLLDEEAYLMAYKWYLVSTYNPHQEEHDEAMEKMRLTADELCDQECKILKEIWRCPGRRRFHRSRRPGDASRAPGVSG